MTPNRNTDRLVFILQGVSGAGKSTLARQKKALNERNGVATVIVSADDFFVQADGTYVHNREKLGEAHAQCRARFLAALGAAPVIIVDNTNMTDSTRAPYVDAATTAGYEVVHLLVGSLDVAFTKFAADRSTHQRDHDHTRGVANGYQKPERLVVVRRETVGFRP